MNIAIIDLGSNSVRLDIRNLYCNTLTENHLKTDSQNIQSELIFSEKLMIQLGKSVFKTNSIKPSTLNNLKQVFKYLKQKCDQHNVHHIHAIATAAMRSATNKKQIQHDIKRTTGIDLKTISGQKEAQYILKAVDSYYGLKYKHFITVDIGGGSTEIAIKKNNHRYVCSIPMGSSFIRQNFFKSAQNSQQDLESFNCFAQKKLKQFCTKMKQLSPKLCFGTSGTVKGIAKVMFQNTSLTQNISIKKLDNLIFRTAFLDKKELSSIAFLEEARVDMFVGGNLWLKNILNFFNCNNIQYCPASLKEGLLLDLIESKYIQNKINKTSLKTLHQIKSSSDNFKTSKLSSFCIALKSFNQDELQSLHELFTNMCDFKHLCNSNAAFFELSYFKTYCEQFAAGKIHQNESTAIISSAIEYIQKNTFPKSFKKLSLAFYFMFYLKKNSLNIETIKKIKHNEQKFFKISLNKKTTFLKQKQLEQIKKKLEECFNIKLSFERASKK